MRSIVTVTTAATVTKLTTLARVKDELKITDNASNDILNSKIDEASDDIGAALGFSVPSEVVSETFWHESQVAAPEYLTLNRYPVSTIASITVDDVVTTNYRLDAKLGLLYCLDASGYPCVWCFCKSIVIAYTGGYVLPGVSGRDLPFGIEGGCIDLVQSFWQSRGRDPSVKSEDIPGVRSVDYWVGSIGEEGELPPSVQMKIAPYRRPSV